MNTARPTSRNANPGGPMGTAPRRKVASMAQMDISSMASFQGPAKPVSYSGGSSTVSSSGRPIVMASNNSGNGSSSYSSNVSNSSGSQGGGAYPNVAYMTSSNAMGHNVTSSSSSNSTAAPPRLSSVNRGRSSNSVATNASYRSTTSNGNGTITGVSGARVAATASAMATGGSVTSDDGTISEDSDRAGDEMQLLSGGNSSNAPFGSLGRHASAGSMYSPSGSKQQMRTRTSSSTVGLSNGNSNNNSGSTTPTHIKPMRIAAGASIKVDSAPSTGNGFASISANTGSSSLLSVRQTGNGGGDDGGSTVSGISGVSGISSSQQQQQQQQPQPTVRSVKTVGSTLSNASAAAAATKLAEENRRAEEAARTRRKIADLEISNASLLSINSSLEATIRKQASEMQELKIRMQASHYGDLGVTAADLALAQNVEAIELTEAEKQDELTFKRLCLTIEQMVFDAKQALDQSLKPAGVKVLTLYDMYEKEALEEAAAAAEAQGEAGAEDGDFEEVDESGQGAAESSISRVHLEDVDHDERGTSGDLNDEDHDKSDSVVSTDEDSPKNSNSSADSLATPPTSTRTIMSTSFSPPPPPTSLAAVAT
ncbi:hypothetical protein EMPS_06938 [Entomortierella parvispora]|uniref:Uncharacterized protein n=1 Tax=Entomortierella parvispora TaxID=205924 RepID=A0A9P3HD74_9FUNG|nr:hypothetical protein EMPS_06938 [Entomortierella parvispora]